MQSKNTKCNCGSGNLYKRCCMINPKPNYKKSEIKLPKLISSLKDLPKVMDYPNKVFDEKYLPKKDILYVSNLNNIPIDIKKTVEFIVTKFPPSDSECIRYSQFISSSIEGVKVEIGLYNFDEIQNNFGKDLPNNNGWHKIGYSNFETSFYVEDGKVWGIHCWNSYKNIHFDCLRDLRIRKRLPNQWVRYKLIDSLKFDFDTSKTKEKTISMIKDDLIRRRMYRLVG